MSKKPGESRRNAQELDEYYSRKEIEPKNNPPTREEIKRMYDAFNRRSAEIPPPGISREDQERIKQELIEEGKRIDALAKSVGYIE